MDGSSDEDEGFAPQILTESEEKFLKAAEEGNVEVFEGLLSENPDLMNTTDSDGYTAIHRAAYSGKTNIITSCLKNGANIEAGTSDGWTALHSAGRWNSFECAKLLLENGADINAKSLGGQTPLHIAANAGKSRESLTVMLTHPSVRIDLVNDNNETAYQIALRKGRLAGLFELARKSLNEF